MSSQSAVRRDRLRRKLRKAEVDALLVTNCHNVTYLSGFTGEDSWLIVGRDNDLLISDSRFRTQLGEECVDLEARIRPRTLSLVDAAADSLGKMKIAHVGVEAASVSLATHEVLAAGLTSAKLVPLLGMVEELREIKDKGEVAAIRRAIYQAEKSMGVITAAMTKDQTEREIAGNIEHELRRFGGRNCSFEPIVAVGPRSALPHAPPTNRRIGESDFVLVDWGAREDLYVSDLTRVFVTGRISPKLERIYGVVLKAQRRAIESMKPGVSMGAVDLVARSTIEKAGFGKQFGHGLGHGIGLEVHEAPRLAEGNDRQLKPGMVITVEPGIYLPGWGGVRIEDDVLITRNGHRVLSSITKELEACIIR